MVTCFGNVFLFKTWNKKFFFEELSFLKFQNEKKHYRCHFEFLCLALFFNFFQLKISFRHCKNIFFKTNEYDSLFQNFS
jgi:hypothetical protein